MQATCNAEYGGRGIKLHVGVGIWVVPIKSRYKIRHDFAGALADILLGEASFPMDPEVRDTVCLSEETSEARISQCDYRYNARSTYNSRYVGIILHVSRIAEVLAAWQAERYSKWLDRSPWRCSVCRF